MSKDINKEAEITEQTADVQAAEPEKKKTYASDDEIMFAVYTGLRSAFESSGLSVVFPDGKNDGELPATVVGNTKTIMYTGEGKAAKLEYSDSKISLLGVVKDGDIISSDFTRLGLVLLDEYANEKDVRYVVNDFSDTLVESFGTKTQKPIKSKLPTPVAKAAVKGGLVSYDPNTLANRFTTIYPELRQAYKDNCETYGEFLPEDFFTKYGNDVVKQTIQKNNPTEMKKLFKLLNEIYEDGTNATQSLITVTILGSLENDQEMLANCVDYMSDELTVAAINVNKYLWSNSGKGARMRLENPPKYKVKKNKNIMSKLGM